MNKLLKSRILSILIVIFVVSAPLGGMEALADDDGMQVIFTDVTSDTESTLKGEAKIKVSVRGVSGDVNAVQVALKFTGALRYKSIDFLIGENNPPECFFIPPNAALVNNTGTLLPSVATGTGEKLEFAEDITDLFVITFAGDAGDKVRLSLNNESLAGTYCTTPSGEISANPDTPSIEVSASARANEGINATVKIVMDKVDNFQIATSQGYADSKITLSVTDEVTGSCISTTVNTVADINGGHFDSSTTIPTFLISNRLIAGHTYKVELRGTGYVTYVREGVDFSSPLVITNEEFIPGDINSDGVVDIEDKREFDLIRNGEYNESADFNRSGRVDGGDDVFSHIEDIPASALPDAPSGLGVSAGQTSITLSWTKPSDGGSPITGYVVRYGASNDNLDKSLSVNDGTALQATVTGLNSDSTYYLSVAAINANGTGNFSLVASVRTAAVAAPPSPGGEGGGNGGGTGGGGTGGGVSVGGTSAGVSTSQFTDLGSHEWAKDSIYKLKEKNIINGVTNTEFAPADNIRRADFILILVRMLNINTPISDGFDDVHEGSYYYDAVLKAKSAGIASGNGVSFMPEAAITRQDLITLSYRAFLSEGYITQADDAASLDAFADKDNISDYAKTAMASMVKAGIIQGSYGNVNPLGNATRAEVAVMCARLLELIK